MLGLSVLVFPVGYHKKNFRKTSLRFWISWWYNLEQYLFCFDWVSNLCSSSVAWIWKKGLDFQLRKHSRVMICMCSNRINCYGFELSRQTTLPKASTKLFFFYEGKRGCVSTTISIPGKVLRGQGWWFLESHKVIASRSHHHHASLFFFISHVFALN